MGQEGAAELFSPGPVVGKRVSITFDAQICHTVRSKST
jgi:hypothetical protein